MPRIILFALALTTAHACFGQSVKEMAGQLLMVGVPNTIEAHNELREDIRNRNLGGVLFFAYNIAGPLEASRLTSELQDIAETTLFIATDQEGGRVARLDEQNGFAATQSAYTTGTVWASVDSTRSQASTMAGWFVETGINTNLAPVVDLNVNLESPAVGALGRSYSSDPHVVADHATAFANVFNEHGIAVALKHFPGHGSAKDDSHNGFTDITHTWTEDELVPFSEIITRQPPDMVMSGHLFHEKKDAVYPASLSTPILTDLLRDSLGFDGIIISDELFMRAVSDNYGFDEAVVQALKAGTDILLFSTNLCSSSKPCGDVESGSLVDYVTTLIDYRVRLGQLTRADIKRSYDRVMRLKSTRTHVPNRAEIPTGIALVPPYPNPARNYTNLTWEIPHDASVSIMLIDVVGREITWMPKTWLAAGTHSRVFQTTSLSSGSYLVRLQIDELSVIERLIISR